jgi:hypothetical protein
MTYLNERGMHLISEGKCPICGKVNDSPRRFCLKCHNRHVNYQRKQKAICKKLGICFKCRQKHLNGTIICKDCNKKIYNRKKKEGRVVCTKKYKQKRIKEGLCVECCQPIINRKRINQTYCNQCITKRSREFKVRYNFRKENGFCVICKNPVSNSSVHCEKHRLEANERSKRNQRRRARNGKTKPVLS